MRIAVAALVALARGAFAACGSGSSTSARPAPPARPFLEFHATSGGFGPAAHDVVIRRDGSAVLRSQGAGPKRFHMPRAAVRQLRTLLTRMRFTQLRSYYGPPAATDQPSYTITFRGHTVRSESGSPPNPPRLWAFIAQLESISREAERPFVVYVTRTWPQLDVLARADGSAEIDGDTTRRISRACVRHLRSATLRVRTAKMKPGFVPRTLRNPPPTIEITRAFRSFHARLDRPRPRGVTPLLRRAKRARASGRC